MPKFCPPFCGSGHLSADLVTLAVPLALIALALAWPYLKALLHR